MKDKFLWKEGDIILKKDEIPITEEQKKRAKEVLDKTIKDFKRRLREAKQ